MKTKTKLITLVILFLAGLIALLAWSWEWKVAGWIITLFDAIITFNILMIASMGVGIFKDSES